MDKTVPAFSRNISQNITLKKSIAIFRFGFLPSVAGCLTDINLLPTLTTDFRLVVISPLISFQRTSFKLLLILLFIIICKPCKVCKVPLNSLMIHNINFARLNSLNVKLSFFELLIFTFNIFNNYQPFIERGMK